jgi:ubiquitin-conjugating enzyme E2 R
MQADRCTDFKFKRTLYHPNVYEDGRLCISILHAPGDDEMSGESAAIRWSPAQRVESVLLSILSLLDDANVSSPANVDASVMYRDKPDEYKKMVEKDLEASRADIPEGFVIPTTDAYNSKKDDNADFMDDWGDSDAELDFDEDDSGVDDEDMEVDDASLSGEDEEDEDV